MKLRENKSYGWVVLSAFTLNYGAVVITFMTLGLLLPAISEELSLSPSQQGWLASSLLFGNLLFEMPLNWWLSRYRPWRVSSVAFLTTALIVALQGWSPTFAVLLAARIGLGLFWLSSQPPRTLLILQWMPKKQIPLANGVLFSLLAVVEGLGFIAIPLLLVWLGNWRSTLYFWAGVCLVLSVMWVFIGGDRLSPEYIERMRSQVKTPLSSLFRYKEPWIMGLGLAGTIGGRLAFDTFWPTFTGNEYGIALTVAGLIIAVISIAGAPAMLLSTSLPFFANRTPMMLTVCGLGLTASYLGIIFTGSLPLLFLLAIVNGLSFGFFPLMLASLYDLPGIKPREVAVAVALVYTLMWAGATAGPLVTGFVQEATGNLQLALFITSIGPLALTIAGLTLMKSSRRPVEPRLSPAH
ncbi:MAG: MFS transporter [Chloroflexi bacterium]|nr:MFS transporter [Chloroflexota bacterium]